VLGDGAGETVTDVQVGGVLEPQALFAVTHTLPPEVLFQVTLIEVVPCPELIVTPDGTVQV